ncbi:MBL fold metallo-hydrolase [bacterium]|nr:MBL fold metallo-hydrolase [bacterium]
MFGVIPRSLWQRFAPPDENNLIDMVTNLFVLTAHGKHMLFDAGLGDTLSERERKIYGIEQAGSIERGLAGLGLTADDIEVVILTHLHTDHAAGALKLEGDTFVPRFPNARHMISRAEWQAAMSPNERTSAVYVPERYQALEDAGLVELIEPDCELFPGIRAVHTGGHTEGHFGIEMESKGRRAFYYSDIIPSRHHLPTAYVPATDLDPMQSMHVKRTLVDRLIDEEVVVAFDHDVDIPLGRVYRDGRRFRVEPAEAVVSQSS